MRSDELVLGFDTSAAHCAAALLCGDRILAARAEDMARGQAERLMGLLQEVLEEGGVTARDLSRIGVGVGPGNFTGIRISVAAARGLALSLEIPAFGVNGFEVISLTETARHVPVISAPRDQVYAQAPGQPPALMDRDAVDALGLPVTGLPDPRAHAICIARCAAERDVSEYKAPVPLYIKPADAAVSRDKPPAIVDDIT